MKEISIEQIKDYQYCRMMYYLKHELGFKNFENLKTLTVNRINDKIMEEHRSEALTNALLRAFRKIKDEGEVGKREILNIYGQEFFKNFNASDILGFSGVRARSNPYIVDYEIMEKLIDEFIVKKEFFPVIAGQRFSTKIDGVKVSGRVDLVTETSDKVKVLTLYEIVCPAIRTRELPQVMTNYSMNLLFGSYILQEVLQVKDGIKCILDIAKSREVRKKRLEPRDIDVFKEVVNETIEDIEKKAFRPQPNSARCLDCSYINVCNEYYN